MPKIKEVYEYNNGSWENGTPIGADASNVDVALSDSTSTRDLQSVLGNVSVSDSSIKTQLSGKVDTDSGDIKDTVVSVLDPSSATDTSEDIDSTDVIVAAGEDQTTMWSKFNTFRKRVSNKFSNFLINSVEDVLEPSDTKTYSQAALNSYFADVIGYKTDADVASIGSVADQLSTLNNNLKIYNYVTSETSQAALHGLAIHSLTTDAYRLFANFTVYYSRIAITTASPVYGGYRSSEIQINWPANLFTTIPIAHFMATSSGGAWANNGYSASTTQYLFYFSAGASLDRAIGLSGTVFGNISSSTFNNIP